MKKLLILAGVIALTSSLQTFANENPVPPNVQGPCPIKKECPGPKPECKKMKKMHCEAIKQLETDLKLTDEQKAQAKAIRESEAEKIKPIKEQIKLKHQEMKEIFDMKLTFKERQDQLAPIRKDLFALKKQIWDIKNQSKKDFEAILTKKQLKKLEKIKQEHREQFKKAHKERMHQRHERMRQIMMEMDQPAPVEPAPAAPAPPEIEADE